EVDVDVAIVGAGGAGLSLLVELDRIAARTGRPAPTVALVDPVARTGPDRTWCFWDTGPGDLEPAVTRAWDRVGLVDRHGRDHTLSLHPLRYVMIASTGFYDLAAGCADRLGVVRVGAPADEVRDGARSALVRTPAGTVRARWVFDSRPVPPRSPPRTAWLQHFRGWTLRFAEPVLDPDRAVLMDFTAPQPAGRGLAFGYVLPLSADRGLVEYTVFSRERLTGAAYDDALRAYLAARWPGVASAVEAVEDGAIPMTDAVHARRAGDRVFRLGTAGGATRGSTGYTFAAMQRQAQVVAQALFTGGDAPPPVPPPPYPARHRWMDAVLLRALDAGLVDGPELFARLFRRNPPARVLRFLDGASTPVEELAVMLSAPVPGMTLAAAVDALARLRPRGPGRTGIGGRVH
ncbi:MAG TPA: lycopene cyclase family protein, partial [Kineosporiaceae bacterium]|nr:lycopene cyclase family protein [Kineosporiaceae bacterium]